MEPLRNSCLKSTYQNQQSNLSQNNYIASTSGSKLGCVVKQLLGFIVQINRMMQCAQQSGLLPGVRSSTNLGDSLGDSLFAHPFRYIQEKIVYHTNEYISLFFSLDPAFRSYLLDPNYWKTLTILWSCCTQVELFPAIKGTGRLNTKCHLM